jgi:LysR family positive regulator for ilvC
VDTDALKQFLELSRTLHFGRASQACHISPSALSRSLQRLEEELGAPLLVRDNRRVALTAEGVRVQRFASETLEALSRVQGELRSDRQRLGGVLSLFASVTAAHSFLPAVLGRFRAAYPDVTLRLETGYAVDALARLSDDSVDVTVAALPDTVPRALVSRVITRTPLSFVAPRTACEVSRMVDRGAPDWGQVPMVLPESGLTRRSIERWFRARGLSPRVYGEVSGNEAALSLVALGCGVGIVPGLVLEKSPLRAEVRSLDVRPALPELRVGLCVKRRRLQEPVVRAFWGSVGDAPAATGAD